MKNYRSYSRLIFLPVIPLVMAGCAPIYYAPNEHNVPLFTEKKEVRVSASYQALQNSKGGSFQTALSVSDHIGIMMNGLLVKSVYDEYFLSGQDKESLCRGNLLEFGTGYYTVLDRRLKSDFVFETYGGIGFGKYRNSTASDIWPYEASYQRLFIQPSAGLKSKHFEVAVSTRLAGLNYSNYRMNSGQTCETLEKFTLLLEPAITLRAGFENVKVQLQSGLSFNLNNPELEQEYFYFGAGIYIELKPWIKNPPGN
jgi:hypothetical protein